MSLSGVVATWYVMLSGLNAALAGPIRDLADGLNLPVASALLFGLLGATSPCQLTTNAGALAYIARGAGTREATARGALAYLLAKVLVYTLLGAAVILAGRQLAQAAIPLIVLVRKALGPTMILLGLHLLGRLPLRLSIGWGLADWLEARAGSGARGAFLLGTAFSLAFCPTLFLLFFGLTIPLALTSPIGMVFPGVFSLGTALPLLGLAGLLTLGVGAHRVDTWLRRLAGIVLVLAGLNDTVVYWLL